MYPPFFSYALVVMLGALTWMTTASLILQSRKEALMSQAFDTLKAQCDASVALMQQAVTTINELVAKIPSPENVVDPVAMAALTSELQTASTALQSAVTAATPAPDPAPVPPATS